MSDVNKRGLDAKKSQDKDRRRSKEILLQVVALVALAALAVAYGTWSRGQIPQGGGSSPVSPVSASAEEEPSGSRVVRRGTPEEAVVKFLTALNKGRYEDAVNLHTKEAEIAWNIMPDYIVDEGQPPHA